MSVIRYLSSICELKELIGAQYGSGKLFAFVSDKVAKIYPSLIPTDSFRIVQDEADKHIHTAIRMWQYLLEKGAERRSSVLAIGGGAITDLSGFVASTYMRGIASIYVPTTLLAMVDACVGGKTAINLDGIKNSIGTFHEPTEVWICPDLLLTLPRRDLLSGYAEIIKQSVLAGGDMFIRLMNTNPLLVRETDWTTLIRENIAFKQSVVSEDVEERKGCRIQLNLGHTIGHAIETMSMLPERPFGKPVLHGEAVAAGLICELYLSALQSKGSTALVREVMVLCRNLYRPIPILCKHLPKLIEIMYHDKKNISGKINFISVQNPGKYTLMEVKSEENIKESLDFYRETFG